jgi:hypothetical protein
MTKWGATEDRSSARSGVAYLWVAAALAFVASAPALFAREIFGDDWTVYYVYWTQGAASVADMMRQVAHTGYAIPMTLFLTLGQDTPEVAARMAGLGCHLVNGFLLYRILSSSQCTRAIAALTAALFLLSPFYVIRLTQNALYDFFLVFYLLSYMLMNAQARLLRWAAPLSLFLSLSLETLIALEPLRLLLAWRQGERWMPWFARLVPFWLAILAVIVLRLTIMGKSGHYSGQYAAVHDINVVISSFYAHLRAFLRALSFAGEYALALFGRKIGMFLILSAVAAFAWLGAGVFRTKWLPKATASAWTMPLLVLLGAAIAVIGALPYALAGIFGDVTRGESRLLFPSQFGVLLLIATGIQCVPLVRLRSAIAGGTIALFALSMAHDSKWLLYDGLVTTDLMRQARAALLVDPEPKVVELKISPPSYTLFFRNRCLGAADMNAAQMILRDERRERSFIYTDNCGDFTNPDLVPQGRCPVSYVDEGFACPARRETWTYRAAPGIPTPDDIGIVELLSAVRGGASSMTGGRGELVKLTGDQPSPLAKAEFKPSCRRPGVRALLWLMGLPATDCEESPAGE